MFSFASLCVCFCFVANCVVIRLFHLFDVLSYLIALKIEIQMRFCVFVCVCDCCFASAILMRDVIWSTKMEVVDHCSAFASTNLLHLNPNAVPSVNRSVHPLVWIHWWPAMVIHRYVPLPTLVQTTSEYDTPTFEED